MDNQPNSNNVHCKVLKTANSISESVQRERKFQSDGWSSISGSTRSLEKLKLHASTVPTCSPIMTGCWTPLNSTRKQGLGSVVACVTLSGSTSLCILWGKTASKNTRLELVSFVSYVGGVLHDQIFTEACGLWGGPSSVTPADRDYGLGNYSKSNWIHTKRERILRQMVPWRIFVRESIPSEHKIVLIILILLPSFCGH